MQHMLARAHGAGDVRPSESFRHVLVPALNGVLHTEPEVTFSITTGGWRRPKNHGGGLKQIVVCELGLIGWSFADVGTRHVL